jgi:hypothetical protein
MKSLFINTIILLLGVEVFSQQLEKLKIASIPHELRWQNNPLTFCAVRSSDLTIHKFTALAQ